MEKVTWKDFAFSNIAEILSEQRCGRLKYYPIEKYFFLPRIAHAFDPPELVSETQTSRPSPENIPSVCKCRRRCLYRERALHRKAKCHKNAELSVRQRHEVAINTRWRRIRYGFVFDWLLISSSARIFLSI